MRSSAVLPLAALLLLSACSDGDDAPAPAPTSSSSTAATSTSTTSSGTTSTAPSSGPTAAPTSEPPLDGVSCPQAADAARRLATAWSDVVTTAGSPVQARYASDFSDDAAEAVDDSEESRCVGTTELQALADAADQAEADLRAGALVSQENVRAVGAAGQAYAAAVGSDAVFTS